MLSSRKNPYPIFKRAGQVFEFKSDGELPLSMITKSFYTDREPELMSGDTFIFYTDGVIEAQIEIKTAQAEKARTLSHI